MRRSMVTVISIVVLAILIALASPAPAVVPNPTIIGPIPVNAPLGDPSHDYPQFVADIDYAGAGYAEEEYFFEGFANRYNTPLLATGSIISTGHPYKSRLIVRRPTEPAHFNGTVIVEWVNVTSGYNNDAMFKASTAHLLRAGYAYVGVSAQRVGIHGPAGLRAWSPIRYSTLDVTVGGTINDDSLSYDIFSQAAQAVRQPIGIDIMGGLPVQRVIAAGASQSQGRLVIYHNSIHPLAGVIDGYFLFLGIGGRLRTDLAPKVFKVDTENDVALLGEAVARQADSDHLRTWEIAGTSHVGFVGFADRVALTIRDSLPIPNASACTLPALSHVPTYQVLNAVYDHLSRWVADGTSPPTAPRIDVVSIGSPTIIARDGFGNALGGIRLSQHAVPTGVNTGVNTGPGFCFLYGTHIDFDAATLASLYRNHGAYVGAVARVNNDNVATGYILAEDAEANKTEAGESGIGKQ